MDYDGHKGVFLRPDGDYRCDEFNRTPRYALNGKIDLIFDDRQKALT